MACSRSPVNAGSKRRRKTRSITAIERAYGSFARSFVLPDDADAENVKAEFKDGMLTVHVSKLAKAKPKQIEVA